MTVRTKHNSIYRLLNRDYHESFDLYAPRLTDFHELIATKLPAGWAIKRSGIWFQCGSQTHILPEQGWKIHVASSRADAREILNCVSSVLFAAEDAAFKFALDVPTLSLLNGKNWPRGASGKFITVYPTNSRRFLELIEELYNVTRGFQGPHILSDHRYKDSKVIFFRYGGMRGREALNVAGEREQVLLAPDGIEYSDRRLPYPETPAWADRVVPLHQHENEKDPYSLRDGRFHIDGVIEFSSAGGVYRGTDLETNASVIIKEARPCIEVSDDTDAVTLLKKEHRILTLLEDTGIAPRPIDLFQEGTHWFLVEEQIQGQSLSAYSASHNILLRTRPSDDDFQTWYQSFCNIARRLIEIVQTLQRRNVVFSDLSPNNLIATEGNLKLIDFEGAYERDVDPPTNLYTPGFISQNRLEGGAASFEDDYYSVGAVLMSYLFPVNGFFHLKPEAKVEMLASIQRDARLPIGVVEMILALMQHNGKPHAIAGEIAQQLPATCAPAQPPEPTSCDYTSIIQGIAQHLLHVASYDRPDRLFPADPKLFATNPLSVAYGAAGIAYALKKTTGAVPGPIIDWILAHPVSAATYAPGLYVGISGIAWALLEIGERVHAEKLFQLTLDHTLLDHRSDLFYGSAGWGMTSLRFFGETGDELYLQQAMSCGAKLLDRVSAAFTGNSWTRPTNQELGLAHGGSGIALFLLYLYLVTQQERFLAAGRQLLETELAAGICTPDGGLSWTVDASSRKAVYPYWRHGSAGIGAVVVRYQRVVGNNFYRDVVEKIFIDTDRKYAVLPGRFSGLCGIGDFLLDAWTFTGRREFNDSAHQVAQAMMRFKVDRQGVAFPGDVLSRLSCDYGTGSAGIALFLNRLMGNQGSDFLLDDLFGLGEGVVSGFLQTSSVQHLLGTTA